MKEQIFFKKHIYIYLIAELNFCNFFTCHYIGRCAAKLTCRNETLKGRGKEGNCPP